MKTKDQWSQLSMLTEELPRMATKDLTKTEGFLLLQKSPRPMMKMTKLGVEQTAAER